MAWVKICGTTSAEDAIAAVNAGVNALGFIFAPSPRRIQPVEARNIVAQLPATVQRVGVFVNETPQRIREVSTMVGLSVVQLHGDEGPDYIRDLWRERELLSLAERGPAQRKRPTRVFKVVKMDEGAEETLHRFVDTPDLVDGIFLESAVSSLRGGSGQPFDWDKTAALLKKFDGKTRFVVAGGLRPENVGDAIRTLRPWGVDVCTGVEKYPGVKNSEAMRAFVQKAREAER